VANVLLTIKASHAEATTNHRLQRKLQGSLNPASEIGLGHLTSVPGRRAASVGRITTMIS
jgi:hypothetical protein